MANPAYSLIAAGGTGYTAALAGGNLATPYPSGLSSANAGALLLMHTWANSTSLGAPDTALNALGWHRLPGNATAPCDTVYARIYVGDGSDPTSVTFQWDATHQAAARIFAFGGNVWQDLTTILAGSSERATNAAGKIAVNALGVTGVPANCMAVACGHCLKTATNNGSTYGNWTSNTGFNSGHITPDYVPNGSAGASGFWWYQQTTATALVSDLASLTNTDTSANTQGLLLFLKTDPNTEISGAPVISTSASGTLTSGAIAGGASASTSAAAALTTAIQAAGSASAGVTAVGSLTNWTTVTLAGTQYTGVGGIHDPNFWKDVDPPVGTTLYYDASKVTIYPNGEISATTNNCSAVVEFFDGTAWSVGIIIITPQLVSYASVVAASAGAMTTAITMAGAAFSALSATGNLTAGIHLAGNALAIAQAAAALTTGIQLNAAALINITATGALSGGQASLQGNATVLSQALAQITTQIALAGQVTINSTVAGALSAQIQLNAAAVALTQANAQIQTAIQLVGNANVVSSAAGAALLTTAFAGAANVVSSAMGALLTGLLLAGNALVNTHATADLSTGITLAGGAIVDSAAAFKPPGAESQFGRAVINVLSPTGLPVARSTFIVGSACIVTIAYYNAKGDAFVPNAVRYSVQDESTGFTLVPATDISNPELSNAVTITGNQNTMINLSRNFELHQILFQITDGASQVSYASAEFELVRAVGTVN